MSSTSSNRKTLVISCPNGCELVRGDPSGLHKVYESAGPDSRWVVCPCCKGSGTKSVKLYRRKK